MDKIDLRKQWKPFYTAKSKPAIIDVPEIPLLMIDGRGDPNSSEEFKAAIGALYGLSYTLKFTEKQSTGRDWTVMGLEGLWWADDMRVFAAGDRDAWKWTLMIAQPPIATQAMVDAAAEALRKKGKGAGLDLARLERLTEGLSVQVMHVGPYDAEEPTVQAMHEFARAEGYRLRGKHHEIYMSDARRVPPERLKTILRQPVERA